MTSLLLVLAGPAIAGDWPTFMHDNARSGRTDEVLPLPLELHWQVTPPEPLRQAWPPPQHGYGEIRKLTFDNAFAAVAAGNTVCFGSSVDNAIHALDAATGRELWRFATDGAVRLAPTIDGGRVYAGSDDGFAYCLDAAGGRLLWKQRCGSDGRRLLGHGRLVSPWPVRTGVVVAGGRAYFGGGVFSFETPRLWAVDAATGTPAWSCEVAPKLNFSAQGYLMLDQDRIYAPSGRNPPMAFERATGKHLFSSFGNKAGAGWGTYGLLAGGHLVAGTQMQLWFYDLASGKKDVVLQPALRLVAGSAAMHVLTPTAVKTFKLALLDEIRQADALPKATTAERAAIRQRGLDAMAANLLWQFEGAGLESMILAGETLIVGGRDEIVAFAAGGTAGSAPARTLWRGEVKGLVTALAAANGRLLASTDMGEIYCFATGRPPAPAQTAAAAPQNPGGPVGAAVATMLKEAGVSRGHCLLLGARAASLAPELARVAALRLYCALAGDGYPKWFANIIVIDKPEERDTAMRLLKPHGGCLFLLHPEGSLELLLRRGGLPGAADWSHQYANPANTGTSADTALALPLSVLWYGEPGSDTQQERHTRGPAPLVAGGRVYLQCETVPEVRKPARNSQYLICFDAYNGVEYWRRPLPGATRQYLNWGESNLAAAGNELFVASGASCHRLNGETGEDTAVYAVPPPPDGGKPRLWSYVAVSDGVLVGSTTEAQPNTWLTIPAAKRNARTNMLFSDAVFAIDLQTGKQLWCHRGANIKKNTVAISDGTVFLADAGVLDEARRAALWEEELDVEGGKTLDRKGRQPSPVVHPPAIYELLALDLHTGTPKWRRQEDLSRCGGDTLVAMVSRDILLIGGYTSSGGHYDRQHTDGLFAGRRMLALNARDGTVLWKRETGHRQRPLISGDMIVAVPFAFDLKTGEPRMIEKRLGLGRTRTQQWRYPMLGCGLVSAAPAALFGRRGAATYADPAEIEPKVNYFYGLRPGCWINMVPAGGLLVQTEASSGCTCLYPVQCTAVFAGNCAE